MSTAVSSKELKTSGAQISSKVTASCDPHRFDIHEFADAVGGEFAAVAGTFYATEGDAGVGGDHFVDEDHAGFEFVDEAFTFAVVGGPGAGAEAEAAVVGECDRFVDIFDTEQRGDGAEKLFAVGGRFFRGVGENCGGIVVAGLLEGM